MMMIIIITMEINILKKREPLAYTRARRAVKEKKKIPLRLGRYKNK